MSKDRIRKAIADQSESVWFACRKKWHIIDENVIDDAAQNAITYALHRCDRMSNSDAIDPDMAARQYLAAGIRSSLYSPFPIYLDCFGESARQRIIDQVANCETYRDSIVQESARKFRRIGIEITPAQLFRDCLSIQRGESVMWNVRIDSAPIPESEYRDNGIERVDTEDSEQLLTDRQRSVVNLLRSGKPVASVAKAHGINRISDCVQAARRRFQGLSDGERIPPLCIPVG